MVEERRGGENESNMEEHEKEALFTFHLSIINRKTNPIQTLTKTPKNIVMEEFVPLIPTN